jgi:Lrp/AsnC family transcriptional regulator for asnA, asnC and gidA
MEEFQLDNLDHKIIDHLRSDGRKSFTELADELEASVSTIRNRYNKLVEEDVLKIIGRAEPQKLGLNAYSRVMIAVRPAHKTNKALDDIIKIDEISFLAITSGKFNIEINLMCTNNSHFLKILDQIRSIDGVDELQTTMYLNVLKWGRN